MAFFTAIRTMERRKLLLWGGISTVSVIVLIVIIVVATSGSNAVTKGSDALLNVPLVDGHNDLPNNLRERTKNQLKDFKFETNLKNDSIWGSTACQWCYTDLPRLREGRVGSQFWVAYVKCDTEFKDAVAQTLEQIDVIKRLVKKYPDDLQFVTTADGIMDAFSNKKIGSLIGVEGGHSIDSRVGVLRTFYDLGVRYMTLTHTCTTPWADASPDTTKPVLNLTDFGENIVREMNKLGMLVDLSHVSANVMRQALQVSKAPVMFSHSNAYTIYNHHRNVPDDVLDMVRENKGIVMVNFYSGFLVDTKTTNATLANVIAHINYIANRAGVDHVGIGADFDGVDETAKGLEDVSKYPVLFDALYTNNSELWSVANLEKLAGKNLIRVFKRVEEVRDEFEKEPNFEEWVPKENLTFIIPEKFQICRTERDVAGNDVVVGTTPIPPQTQSSSSHASSVSTDSTITSQNPSPSSSDPGKK